MAIDTDEKRKSISFVIVVSPGVTPNASQDVEWRQEAGYTYSGIDMTPPPAFEPDHDLAAIMVDDLGFHLSETDLGWKISSSLVDRLNINDNDVGWKIQRNSLRWNIEEE